MTGPSFGMPSPAERVLYGDDYPLDALPPLTRDFVKGICLQFQCVPGFAAPSVMSVLTASVQGSLDVMTPFNTVIPTAMYFCTVNPSGTGKSPLVQLITKGFDEFEAGVDFEQEARDAASGKRRKSDEPTKPLLAHQFIVNKCTSEGLLDLNRAGAYSLYCSYDEGGQFFKNLNLQTMCSRWDGSPLRETTRSEGSFVLHGRRTGLNLTYKALSLTES